MVTTVESTIGDGTRDYQSIAAWQSAIPSDLVAADEVHVGILYPEGGGTNGEWVLTGNHVEVGTGKTTDSTRYAVLRAADGMSFRDHPDRPLRYDPQTDAVSVSLEETDARRVRLGPYCRVEGIQFKIGSGSNFTTNIGEFDTDDGAWFFESNLVYAKDASTDTLVGGRDPASISNNVFILENFDCGDGFLRTFSGGVTPADGTSWITHNLLIALGTSSLSENAMFAPNTGHVAKNNIVITAISGLLSFNDVDDSNRSHNVVHDNAAGVGSDAVTNIDPVNVFEDPSSGETGDFRVKSGAASIDSGTLLSYSGVDNDIYRVSRSDPPDIGAEEFESASGGPTLTNATASADGTDGYTGSVDTDTDTGTLYWLPVLDSDPDPSVADVKAGQNQSVTATGTQNVSGTGLSDGVYRIWYVHEDGSSNDSNLASSGTFTIDTTAPSFSSASTDSAGDTVTVTFTEELDTGNDTAAGEWTINVNGSGVSLTSAAIDTGNPADVVIELDTAVTSGDTITADYSGTSLRDGDGNQVATFTGESVTNNSTASDPTVTLDGNDALHTGGLPSANVTGIEVWVIELSSNTVEHHGTGLSTDGSGVLSITLTGSALATGAAVMVAGQKADGRRFLVETVVD